MIRARSIGKKLFPNSGMPGPILIDMVSLLANESNSRMKEARRKIPKEIMRRKLKHTHI